MYSYIHISFINAEIKIIFLKKSANRNYNSTFLTKWFDSLFLLELPYIKDAFIFIKSFTWAGLWYFPLILSSREYHLKVGNKNHNISQRLISVYSQFGLKRVLYICAYHAARQNTQQKCYADCGILNLRRLFILGFYYIFHKTK